MKGTLPIETPPRSLQSTSHSNKDVSIISTTSYERERGVKNLLVETSNLSQLEQEVLQRRSMLRARIHDVYQRVAAWLSTITAEVMERDADMVRITDLCTSELNAAAERILERLDFQLAPILSVSTVSQEHSKIPSLSQIERRYADTSYHLDQYSHEIIPQYYRDHFDVATGPCKSIQRNADDPSYLLSNDSSDRMNMDVLRHYLKLETSAARKAEGLILRRFDSLVGTCAQNLTEETAKRESSFLILLKETKARMDEKRAQDLLVLDKIKELKDLLEQERQERIRGDEHVLQTILKQKELIQEKILEML